MSSSTDGSQLSVGTSIVSNCEIDNYPVLLLFAVEYADGPDMLVGYQNVMVGAREATTAGFSWMPADSGDYRLTIILHACLPCSGDFGIFERVDFPVTGPPVNYIELTISGLKSSYKAGEHIVFSVSAKGASDNACNINSPSVVMRDNGSGKTIYWPNPFGLYYAMGCNGADLIDKTWTYGDDAESEIILDKAGSYTIVASLEEATVEKRFAVE